MSEDRELLAEFKAGNPSALTRVYVLYVDDIVLYLRRGFAFNAKGERYCFKGYKEPWHLENAVQEIFIKAFSDRARHTYDGLRPFRNYLFRIARNAVLDDFRDKKKELVVFEEEDERVRTFVNDSSPETPETVLIDKQLLAFVERFIVELPKAIRPFFELRFKQRASLEQCTKVLQWTDHRVKREEKRVRRLFFDGLKRSGYLDGYRFDQQMKNILLMTLTAALWRLA